MHEWTRGRWRAGRALIGVVLALATTLVGVVGLPAPSASAQDSCTPTATAPTGPSVGVSLLDDACGNSVAVSVAGDATTDGACQGVLVNCVAVSGTGDATNNGVRPNGSGACNAAIGLGCAAVSGTGDATNNANGDPAADGSGGCNVTPIFLQPTDSVSFSTLSVGIGCLAVSGTGNSTNNASGLAGGCNVHVLLFEIACAALTLTGTATNNASGDAVGGCFASGEGFLIGCLAVSGAGDATNNADGVAGGCHAFGGVGATASGLLVGCLAASGIGSATNSHGTGAFGNCESAGLVAIGCETIEVLPS
jgi:hypothetical protein